MKRLYSDKELVENIKAGRPGYMETLCERYRPYLYAAALSILGHGRCAKDAVQDTFLTAFAKIGQLKDSHAVKYWLHSILRNQCRMQQRKAKRIFHKETSELPHQPISPAISRKMEHLQEREAVLKALSHLPEKQRLPLLLRYYSSRTYEEIARLMGVSVGTIRSRLSRGKQKVLKRFNREKQLKRLGNYKLIHKREALYTEAIEAFYQGHRYRLLNHFEENLQLRFTSGREAHGRVRWALEWEEDIESGVRFQPTEILASGSLTILEGRFENPPHDPHHCPPAGTFIFFHGEGEVVRRVHIHYGSLSE